MATTGKVSVDEGSTTNLATYTISEDAVTKHINRSVLSKNDGTDIDLSKLANIPTSPATAGNQTTGNTSLGNIDTSTAAVNTVLGAKADNKSSATDTTAISIVSILKQISASIQAAASSLAGTLPVSGTFWQATQPVSEADGANTTLGAKADNKSTATDTTAITAMSVWKQISASVQAIASSVAGTLTVATHAVTQSGTWTVQPGNTANTTAWKTDGSAVTQPVSVATPYQVAGSDETSTIYSGTTALTPKFKVISAAASGENSLVTAVGGKKIRVLSMFVMAAGTVNLYFDNLTDGAIFADGTNKIPLIANTGFVLPHNPLGWFQTGTVNEALRVNLSAAVGIAGGMVYVEV